MDNQPQASQPQESFFKKITYTQGIYPILNAVPIQNPSRFYAIPLLGFLVKLILLIPVFFEIIFISIWWMIAVMIINPFVVLFTNKYWQSAYSINLGYLRMVTKISFYLFGLTNKYPGFNLTINDNYSLDIPYPENPKKIFAIPIIGFIIRIILLIPYLIFEGIISQAAAIGTFSLAWAVVLFKGRYPEGLFELARDSLRVSISANAYMTGLSDKYPSFYISMNHDKIKIILIAIAIILNGFNFTTGGSDTDKTEVNNRLKEPQFSNSYTN